MLYENTRSTSAQEQEDRYNGNEQKCAIPMIVFSASNQTEDAEAPTQTSDDACDKDCDSFESIDVLKFAWQIAKGMVSKSLFLYVRFTFFSERITY